MFSWKVYFGPYSSGSEVPTNPNAAIYSSPIKIIVNFCCAKKKKLQKLYIIQEIEPTYTHDHHHTAVVGMMHVIMFCDGPCNESVWRSGATADKSQWGSRHDAIVRTTAATLWRSSTSRHQHTNSMHIFFSDNNERQIVRFSFHY